MEPVKQKIDVCLLRKRSNQTSIINVIFYCLSVLKFCAYSDEFYCYSHPDILFEAFSALRPVGLTEGEMLVKVLIIKDFYEFNFCSNTTVSTCELLSKPFPIGMLISLSMIGSRKVIDLSHCPLGCRSS